MNNEQDTRANLPTSPDWSDAPDWAKYFAINANGLGLWYSELVKCFEKKWIPIKGDYQMVVGNFDATDWKNSLQQRPQQ